MNSDLICTSVMCGVSQIIKTVFDDALRNLVKGNNSVVCDFNQLLSINFKSVGFYEVHCWTQPPCTWQSVVKPK